MTPDEMDAENRKYLNDVIFILRLKSGRIAVFDNSRMLAGIVEGDIRLDDIIPEYKPPVKSNRSIAPTTSNDPSSNKESSKMRRQLL